MLARSSGAAVSRLSGIARTAFLCAARALSVSATPKEALRDNDAFSGTFRAADLEVRRSSEKRELPENLSDLVFGRDFSPHVLSVEYCAEKGGWGAPLVKPLTNLSVHPSAPVFHYGVSCFEGMKAYASESKDGDVLLFRPEMNVARFLQSMTRLGLPTFAPAEFLACLKRLLDVDKAFVPRQPGYSIYIRPFCVGSNPTLGVAPPTSAEICILMCPVGPYYPGGLVPIDIFVDEENVRAFPGGTGQYKIGGNYAPTLIHLKSASEAHGCKQVLYTISDAAAGDRMVAECGAMNTFFLLESEETGQRELVTPPLDGTILPGVTRDTILSLCRDWEEFKVSERPVSMGELAKHGEKGTLVEVFGSGTACTIQPIKALVKEGGERIETRQNVPKSEMLSERVYQAITDIQYGRVEGHPWSESIYK